MSERRDIEIPVREVQLSELSAEDQELVAKAKEIVSGAYAPYSHFHVAAALRLESGRIVLGTNQENASYPLGLCAERTALFQSGALYPDDPVTSLVIVGAREDGTIIKTCAPCGGCRQVMLEMADRHHHPFPVILAGPESALVVEDCRDLLPINFDASSL